MKTKVKTRKITKPQRQLAADVPSQTIQCWPNGTSITFRGDPCNLMQVRGPSKRRRNATEEEQQMVRVEMEARIYQERDILHSDSSLVTDLFNLAREGCGNLEFSREWDWDSITNLRPDPNDWGVEQCRAWLCENANSANSDDILPNPWNMDRDALLEFLGVDEKATPNDQTEERLREEAIEVIDASDADIEKWRDAVNNCATDTEIYEWYRVTTWLRQQLENIGECTIDNSYGDWWGRQATGQALIMDGTLQQIAAKFV